MTENSVPSLATAYTRYRPLFFRALAGLARKGLPIPPSDALDVIHDFFVEVWPAVVRSYRPERGAFEGYLYRSFLHFAQRRAQRLRRLDEDALLEAGAYVPDAGRTPEDLADRDTVREALSRLPIAQAELLTAYFEPEAPSERRLARDRGMSRYRLRETLVEALGRIGLVLGTRASGPLLDQDVARALWVDRLSIDQAARALGLTEGDLRERHRRNVGSIASALGRVAGRR